VGAHDDCDRWIENNRRFEPELSELSQGTYLTKKTEESGCPAEHGHDEETDYDDILMKQIDDNLLREIFCGLCQGES